MCLYLILPRCSEVASEEPGLEGKLLLSRFDVHKVLQNGAFLLGSEGAQFNQDEKLASKYCCPFIL